MLDGFLSQLAAAETFSRNEAIRLTRLPGQVKDVRQHDDRVGGCGAQPLAGLAALGKVLGQVGRVGRPQVESYPIKENTVD